MKKSGRGGCVNIQPSRRPCRLSLQVQPRLLLRAQSAASLAPVYSYSKGLALNVYTHHPLDGRQTPPGRPSHPALPTSRITATTGPAINLLRIEENLSAAWQRLSGTYVENLPWLECAERYDRVHTFHYMDPPYWQTTGYGVDFPFENYERMADFMRRCKGKVMVSINDHPDIRRVFEGFHFETLDIRYCSTNQRQGKAEISGELVIMNWEPAELSGLF